MLQLIQLRWLAAVGQVITIGFVQLVLEVDLPLLPMAAVVVALALLNLLSLLRLRLRAPVGQAELFVVLLLDVAALTVQLYLSGGVTNPFISLFLLQVTMAAVLLQIRWAWAMAAITTLCFLGLSLAHRPLVLPSALSADPFRLHLQGLLVCFILDAALLVVFVTRVSGNLRARDARLADLRRQAVEEEHIVRMGLLASGAAHELGTPLATMSVILGDWRHMPALRDSPDLQDDIEEMQVQLRRCKEIISGILLSAGEARGEAAAVTTLDAFLEGLVQEWSALRPRARISLENNLGGQVPIVADPTLKQVLFNLFNNAQEAFASRICLSAARDGATLILEVRDNGVGFAPEMLAQFGNPYRSTKARQGRGLGLFLVVNVVRKLGGRVAAHNRPEGGATVTLSLPLGSIAIERRRADAA
ncbi:HAMP domain-containing histidine kinase [Roseomonas sp. M0104]|uniref:histidine kinase n=2 Tax=Teichococcus coralli TaxID=2545983 RepID=A0A845BE60_9PROT|nr:ATP-binding protein [Pseudoroseomonas coralli]MXP65048.1 HAMP domain-containing histidine kinase [Pseudoroseomonas coralli]